MNIQDIIESIANQDQTVMVDVTKETYSILPDEGTLSVVDEQSRIYLGKDDAIAALFDADLFGWEVESFNWRTVPNGTPWVELGITLFKTEVNG